MTKLFTTTALFVIFAATSVFAQSGLRNNGNFTSVTTHEVSIEANIIDAHKVTQIAKNAKSAELLSEVASLNSTNNNVEKQIAASIQNIADGAQKNFTFNMKENTIEGHALRVSVSYDKRPIGGILNVQVQVMPKFVGIGLSPRAIAKKTVATAVDNLTDNDVNQIVSQMTKELASEMAAQ